MLPSHRAAWHTVVPEGLRQLSCILSQLSDTCCTPARQAAGSNQHTRHVSSSSASTNNASRPPLPPFTEATAKEKVQMAQDAWNTRDPERVSLAYTEDSEWRNRGEFLRGRAAIKEFLTRKWQREQGYQLRKYLWATSGNRIAVCFEYEYHNSSGQWFRAYGNENWEFDEAGLMRKRIASINEAPIRPEQRRIAVDPPGSAPVNTWLAEQGLAGAAGAEFPFGNGSEPCY